MEYIRHLTESGEWAFSNVKSVGEISSLTTANKTDVVSAINELNSYFSLNQEVLDSVINGYAELNEVLKAFDEMLKVEKGNLEQLATDLGIKKQELLDLIEDTESRLNEKLLASDGEITSLKKKASEIEKNLAEKGEEIDGKLVAIEKDIVETNTELSSKLAKTEFDENVGVNKWIATFYPTTLTFDTLYPKMDDLLGLLSNYVEEQKDSVKLYPFGEAKSGILHLFTNIYVTQGKTVTLPITHNSGTSVLLNGGYIYYKAGAGNADVSISLRAGWNTVEFLFGVNKIVGTLTASARLSELVDKMTTTIGVGSKNETRLTHNETLIKQTNEAIQLKADSTVVENLGNLITDNTAQIEVQAEQIASKVDSSTFNNYTGRLEQAETSIVQTSESIKSLATKSDIDTLNGVVETHSSEINQLTEAIELVATSESLDKLTGRVETAEGSIKVTSEKIENLVTKTDFNSATGRIKQAETVIEQTSEAIKLLATKSELNTVNGAIGTLETQVGLVAGELTSKISKTDLNPLEGRVSKTETDIVQTNKDIGFKASKTEVTEAITNSEASMKITAKGIATEVASSAVNGIVIGGRNLARFTNQKDYVLSYNGNGSATSFKIDEKFYYHRATALTTGAIIWGITQTDTTRLIQMDIGETYTLSFKARANKEGFNLNYVYMMNSSGTNQSVTSGIVGDSAMGLEWKTFTFTFKFNRPTDSLSKVMISSQSEHMVDDWFEVKDIQVEKGNKATDYTPAPEDVEVSIKSVKTLIEQTDEAIKLVATKKEMESAISKAITSSESSMAVEAEKIALRVSKTAVGDINVGGSNLLKGTKDFSGNWYFKNLWMLETEKYSGFDVYKRTDLWQGLGQLIYLDVGTYTFSFYGKASKKSNTTKFYTLPNATDNVTNAVVSDAFVLDLTTEWKRYSIKFDVTTAGYVKPRIENATNDTYTSGDGHTTYVCAYKLEKGNVATDWSPSFDDINAKIESVTSSIEQTAESISMEVTKTYLSNAKTSDNLINIKSGWELGTVTLVLNEVQTEASINTRLRYFKNKVPVVSGGTYSFTNENLDYALAIHQLDKDLKLISDSGWLLNSSHKQKMLDNTKFITFLVRSTKTASTVIGASEILATKFCLVEGDIASSWRLSQKDIETGVANSITASKSIQDVRSTNELPTWYYANYPKQTVEEFKFAEIMGVKAINPKETSNYGVLTTTVRWQDKSGGRINQILKTDGITYQRESTADGTAWGEWRIMVDQATMGTYVSQTLETWGVDIVRDSKIISRINASKEGIAIEGSKVNIVGNTTFSSVKQTADNASTKIGNWSHSSDTTTIDGGKIYTQSITTDKLMIGSGNLIYGGVDTFEQIAVGKAPYGLGGSSSNSISADYAKFGTKSLKHTSTADNSYFYMSANTNSANGWLPIDNGKKYIISAYVRTTSSTAVTVQLVPMPRTGKTSTVSTASSKGYAQVSIKASDGWVRVATYVNCKADGEYLSYYIRNNTSGFTSYWDGFMVEEVPNSTVSTPSVFSSGSVTRIDGGSIFTGSITSNALAVGSVTSDELSSTAIDGKLITGAIIRTNSSYTQGVIMDTTGIKGYNSSGVQKFSLDTNGKLTASDAVITGTITAGANSTFQGDITTTKDIRGGNNIYLGETNNEAQKAIYFNQEANITGGHGWLRADIEINADTLWLNAGTVDFTQSGTVDFTGVTVLGVTPTFG